MYNNVGDARLVLHRNEDESFGCAWSLARNDAAGHADVLPVSAQAEFLGGQDIAAAQLRAPVVHRVACRPSGPVPGIVGNQTFLEHSSAAMDAHRNLRSAMRCPGAAGLPACRRARPARAHRADAGHRRAGSALRSARAASVLCGSAWERAGLSLPRSGKDHHRCVMLPVPQLLVSSVVLRSRDRCVGRAFHRSRAQRCRATPIPARRWVSRAGHAVARL